MFCLTSDLEVEVHPMLPRCINLLVVRGLEEKSLKELKCAARSIKRPGGLKRHYVQTNSLKAFLGGTKSGIQGMSMY